MKGYECGTTNASVTVTAEDRRDLVLAPFPVVRSLTTSYPHGGTQVQDMDSFFRGLHSHTGGKYASREVNTRMLEIEAFDGTCI